jgi:crotonobetainyl-CoA:carnitine CoA-transferase CaiB-like acyl-CoA transferase
VKVESLARPDGARGGPPPFFDLLHTGAESVALDFADARDRALLDALVASADVVLESTRPRALAQLGIDATAFVAARAGRVWTSLTGYGREDEAPGRVAYGDDAGVAAGLASDPSERARLPKSTSSTNDARGSRTRTSKERSFTACPSREARGWRAARSSRSPRRRARP